MIRLEEQENMSDLITQAHPYINYENKLLAEDVNINKCMEPLQVEGNETTSIVRTEIGKGTRGHVMYSLNTLSRILPWRNLKIMRQY